MNYLLILFEEVLRYQTINLHHSTVSECHSYVHEKPVGNHPRVYALLTVVLNQISPQPHYKFVWDVEIVLLYLKTSDNSHLSDKDLTHKLTVLMALSFTSSVSSIQHLDIKFTTRNNATHQCFFHQMHKSWRRVKAPPTV